MKKLLDIQNPEEKKIFKSYFYIIVIEQIKIRNIINLKSNTIAKI